MDAPVKALNTEKAKALQAALAQIEKQFGKGSIMRLADGEKIEDIQVVSTGSLGLDIALGVGGLPRGRGSSVPVLILTAADSVEQRVKGLDLGADDYMAKPFSLQELEARVRALTRRGLGYCLEKIAA